MQLVVHLMMTLNMAEEEHEYQEHYETSDAGSREQQRNCYMDEFIGVKWNVKMELFVLIMRMAQ